MTNTLSSLIAARRRLTWPPLARVMPALYLAQQIQELTLQAVTVRLGSLSATLSSTVTPAQPIVRIVTSLRPDSGTNSAGVSVGSDMPDVGCSIRRAMAILAGLPNQRVWHLDLIIALLREQSTEPGYQPHSDPHLDDLVAGLALFARFYEVDPDGAFRHQPEKFDPRAFLRLTGLWPYTSQWGNSVSERIIAVTEQFLAVAEVLDIRGRDAEIPETLIRLRADLILRILRQSYPTKYLNLASL